MAVVADVVVVGAGVIGAAVSFELARSGLNVLVVDKGDGVGHGSTSASSAIIRYHYSTFDGVAAAWESAHVWDDWANHLEITGGSGLATFFRTGAVILDAPILPRDRIKKLFDHAGISHEDWDTGSLRARVPGLDPGRYGPPKRIDDPAFWDEPTEELDALYTPDGGFVDDPMLAAQNLADAAVRRGVRLMMKRTVTEVRRAAGRVAGVVLDDGERIDAPLVVNCAGPWSARINALAGVGADFTITVRPMRQEVHHIPAPPGYNDGDRLGPVIADPDLGTYLRAAPGDVMVVGGTEPECDPLDWIDDPDQANPHATTERFDAQVTRAARRFPELRVPPRPKGISGVYDVASDWTPIYDRTELDGYYVAMGTSGNQFKNAPLAGRIMATLITAVEAGHDHDTAPVTYRCHYTGHTINLGSFSRKREINPYSTGTVMG